MIAKLERFGYNYSDLIRLSGLLGAYSFLHGELEHVRKRLMLSSNGLNPSKLVIERMGALEKGRDFAAMEELLSLYASPDFLHARFSIFLRIVLLFGNSDFRCHSLAKFVEHDMRLGLANEAFKRTLAYRPEVCHAYVWAVALLAVQKIVRLEAFDGNSSEMGVIKRYKRIFVEMEFSQKIGAETGVLSAADLYCAYAFAQAYNTHIGRALPDRDECLFDLPEIGKRESEIIYKSLVNQLIYSGISLHSHSHVLHYTITSVYPLFRSRGAYLGLYIEDAKMIVKKLVALDINPCLIAVEYLVSRNRMRDFLLSEYFEYRYVLRRGKKLEEDSGCSGHPDINSLINHLIGSHYLVLSSNDCLTKEQLGKILEDIMSTLLRFGNSEGHPPDSNSENHPSHIHLIQVFPLIKLIVEKGAVHEQKSSRWPAHLLPVATLLGLLNQNLNAAHHVTC